MDSDNNAISYISNSNIKQSMEQRANRIAAYMSAILIWPLVITVIVIAIVLLMTIGLVSILAKGILIYTDKTNEE